MFSSPPGLQLSGGAGREAGRREAGRQGEGGRDGRGEEGGKKGGQGSGPAVLVHRQSWPRWKASKELSNQKYFQVSFFF